VTGVAYVPYLTGRFPGRANIPGFRWFDRDRYARRPVSLMRFRTYDGLGSYLMDRDLARDCKTLFELIRPSSNIFSGISRGTGLRRNAAYFRRVPATVRFFRTGSWEHIDRAGEGFLLRAARRRRERFTFHTTYSIDEYSHMHGPFSARVRASYLDFDRVIGRLGHLLRDTGQLDGTLLVLGADHGHAEVRAHFDLEAFFERLALKTLYFPKHVARWLDADCAVMVAGNGMGHVYLKGPGRWTERPPADAHLERHPRLVDDLLAEEAIDHVIYRPGHDGEVRVRSRRGSASIRLDADGVTYRPDAGGDPFGYRALPERMSRRHALALTSASDYPDAPVQAAQIFESPRAGDFIVTARPGYDLRVRHERFHHRSCHGTLHRDHMTVPFAMSHPVVDGPARSVDAFPTILSLLGRSDAIHPDLDGQNLAA
jgi:arylsulfatase A-like enzyme